MRKHTEENENVIYMKGSEEAAKENKRKQTTISKRKRLLFCLMLVAVALVAVIIHHFANIQFKGYEIVSTVESDYKNTSYYVEYADNLLKYTPDGASYINENGDVVWSAGINMNKPIADVCGGYAAIADLGGNSVSIFNTEGQVSSLTMPYSICDIDVGNQGAFAVVLESDETNYINMYDKNGESVYEKQTTIDKSGYPLDMSISDDGKKLFVSCILLDGTTVTNTLTAYNFGDVGQNANADRMVGGYTVNDQVISKLEFLDNDTVAAFGTNQITIYSMKEKPSKKAEIIYSGEARSIFCNEGYVGVVYNSDSGEVEHKYRLKLYSDEGKEKFSYSIDFEYDNIFTTEDEIIVTGGSNCLILRKNGSVKFDGVFPGTVISVVPSGGSREYVVVYNDSISKIKLRVKENKTSEK